MGITGTTARALRFLALLMMAGFLMGSSHGLKDQGPLPPFPSQSKELWLNTPPLKTTDLKGQVVLIEIWTSV